MKKESILIALNELRDKGAKRKFSQTVDLIINLKNFDIKKTENKIDSFLVLPNGLGKKVKVCGLVDQELVNQAKEILDHVVTKDQFTVLKKQEIKKLARDYDFFVAQATLMVEIAKYFGKVLGPRGKMPNPKSGCVVALNANLKLLHEKLQKMVRANPKSEAAIKCQVGKETLTDDELAGNIMHIYENVLKLLPREKENLGKVYVKLTMSNAIEVKDE